MPAVQLGILGLTAKPAPVTAGAPGAFAKVLNGTMQATSGQPSGSDGSEESTASGPASGTNQSNAIIVKDPKASTPIGQINPGFKKNPERRPEGVTLALPSIAIPVAQNSPASPTAALNGVAEAAAQADSDMTAATTKDPLTSASGSSGLPVIDAETVPVSASMVKAPITNTVNASLGNLPSNDEHKTGSMPEAGSPLPARFQTPADPNLTTGIENNDPKAPQGRSAKEQPKSEPAPNPDLTKRDHDVMSGSSDMLRPTLTATRPDAMGESNSVHVAPESAIAGATNAKPEIQSAIDPSLIASSLSPVSLVQGNAVDTPQSVPLSLGKNSKLPATSAVKGAAPALKSTAASAKSAVASATTEPQAASKDAGKVRKPDTPPQGGADKESWAAVKDVKTDPPDAVTGKPADTDHAQQIQVVGRPPIQDLPKSSSALSATGPAVPAARDADAAETRNAFPGALVNSAKLIERIGHTEMRVGIQTAELGSVDIRTALSKHQFTAEISVERGDLGRALTSDLPALHSRLSEQRVPFPTVTIQEYSGGNSSNLEQRQRDERRTTQGSSPGSQESLTGSGTGLLDAVVANEADAGSGIDLHM